MTTHFPVVRTRSGTGVGTRLILTALGSTGLIVGAFLDWTRNMVGTDLTWRSLYQQTFFTTPDIWRTVGGAAILLGVVGLLGLAEVGGWLTRLAGVLGVIGFVLFAIQVERSADHSLQAGAWLALGGAVVSVIAGMPGTRTIVE